MKILLTGATGFIGHYVYRQLLQTDHTLYITSRNPHCNLPNCFILDILDYQKTTSILKEIQADVLIHLAWDVTHGEFWTSEKNIDYAKASIHLFETFLEQGGKKIIAAGTCAEYSTSAEPVRENQTTIGELSPYGNAKRLVLAYLESKKTQFNFDFTWFRIFGVFGLGEHQERLIPSIISTIQSKEVFSVKNPDVFFDYIYVDDLAHFIIDAIQKTNLGIINIGTGNSLAVIDVFLTIKNYIETGRFKIIQTVIIPSQNSRIPDCMKLKEQGYNFNLYHGLGQLLSMET